MSDARVRTPKLLLERGALRGVPLSPTDGFVLSRVDGSSSEQEIIASTGMPVDQISASLAKLESLGVIAFEAAAPPPPRSMPPPRSLRPGPSSQPDRSPTPSPPSQPARSHASTSPRPSSSPAAGGVPFSPSGSEQSPPSDDGVLGEDVDLDVEMRRRILETHRTLDQRDYYALLGVERGVDKKGVKRAYFDLAARFHPDRYFRKRLGSYKLRIESIFGRITLAHDTLTRSEKRAEYDAYLEEQLRSRGIEAMLADAALEAKRAQESIERELQALERAPTPSMLPPPSASSRQTLPAPAMDVATRRDALARRLLGGRPSMMPPPPISSRPPTGLTPSDAMNALRRRYEERASLAKLAQARKYMANGEAALASGDTIAAVNAFRVALSLSPGDPELETLARDAQARADDLLSETYVRQALYEDKNGQWEGAARSWTRACKMRPNDANTHERAAHAILKTNGDLHEASRLAQHACKLEPKNARYRVTLANVYLAAGLALNARRELEAAAQLSPHDDTITLMLGRLAK
ncbi:MAG: DnaJ domain-containing protein [Myxococcota bacterium]|nr:DnaJ domain-containing protein [Myxococcota bacterium]